ncbi:MAG TPA: prolipoprotein diacylglyceryl transferase family protein [Anaerolineales bacterium]|nr:prolipoprotein diacylglyceryl transferase family protein [Anaerolineales bacterium]
MIILFRSLFAPPRHLILLVGALWIGLALAEKRSERHNISKDVLNNIVYYGLFGYILGGRVVYAVENYSIFVQSPLSLFSLNLDLFDPLAALLAALSAGLIYGYRQKLSLWAVLDALTPAFATLAIGLSLSHLAAGTAFGSPTDLPWGIDLWNARRHPSQIYELIAASLIFVEIWFRKPNSPPGESFLTFTMLAAASRLFLEAFRGDSTLIFGGLRLAQVIAWIVLASAFFASELIRKTPQTGETESASC